MLIWLYISVYYDSFYGGEVFLDLEELIDSLIPFILLYGFLWMLIDVQKGNEDNNNV